MYTWRLTRAGHDRILSRRGKRSPSPGSLDDPAYTGYNNAIASAVMFLPQSLLIIILYGHTIFSVLGKMPPLQASLGV